MIRLLTALAALLRRLRRLLSRRSPALAGRVSDRWLSSHSYPKDGYDR